MTEPPVRKGDSNEWNGTQIASDTYHVPADKLLRIELVTFDQYSITLGRLSKFLVTTTVGNQVVIHYLKSSRVDSSVDVVTEPVLIYADPGTTVESSVVLSNNTGQACPGSYAFVPNCNGSFSGVLIDVP